MKNFFQHLASIVLKYSFALIKLIDKNNAFNLKDVYVDKKPNLRL
jgi:hypothetical protein